MNRTPEAPSGLFGLLLLLTCLVACTRAASTTPAATTSAAAATAPAPEQGPAAPWEAEAAARDLAKPVLNEVSGPQAPQLEQREKSGEPPAGTPGAPGERDSTTPHPAATGRRRTPSPERGPRLVSAEQEANAVGARPNRHQDGAGAPAEDGEDARGAEPGVGGQQVGVTKRQRLRVSATRRRGVRPNTTTAMPAMAAAPAAPAAPPPTKEADWKPSPVEDNGLVTTEAPAAPPGAATPATPAPPPPTTGSPGKQAERERPPEGPQRAGGAPRREPGEMMELSSVSPLQRTRLSTLRWRHPETTTEYGTTPEAPRRIRHRETAPAVTTHRPHVRRGPVKYGAAGAAGATTMSSSAPSSTAPTPVRTLEEDMHMPDTAYVWSLAAMKSPSGSAAQPEGRPATRPTTASPPIVIEVSTLPDVVPAHALMNTGQGVHVVTPEPSLVKPAAAVQDKKASGNMMLDAEPHLPLENVFLTSRPPPPSARPSPALPMAPAPAAPAPTPAVNSTGENLVVQPLLPLSGEDVIVEVAPSRPPPRAPTSTPPSPSHNVVQPGDEEDEDDEEDGTTNLSNIHVVDPPDLATAPAAPVNPVASGASTTTMAAGTSTSARPDLWHPVQPVQPPSRASPASARPSAPPPGPAMVEYFTFAPSASSPSGDGSGPGSGPSSGLEGGSGPASAPSGGSGPDVGEDVFMPSPAPTLFVPSEEVALSTLPPDEGEDDDREHEDPVLVPGPGQVSPSAASPTRRPTTTGPPPLPEDDELPDTSTRPPPLTATSEEGVPPHAVSVGGDDLSDNTTTGPSAAPDTTTTTSPDSSLVTAASPAPTTRTAPPPPPATSSSTPPVTFPASPPPESEPPPPPPSTAASPATTSRAATPTLPPTLWPSTSTTPPSPPSPTAPTSSTPSTTPPHPSTPSTIPPPPSTPSTSPTPTPDVAPSLEETTPSVEEGETSFPEEPEAAPEPVPTQAPEPEPVPAYLRLLMEMDWAQFCQEVEAFKLAAASLMSNGTTARVKPSQIILLNVGPTRCSEAADEARGDEPSTTEAPDAAANPIANMISIQMYIADESHHFSQNLTEYFQNLWGCRGLEYPIRKVDLVGSEAGAPVQGSGAGVIAAIVIVCVASACFLVLAALLLIMRKRQKSLSYGQRCTPVSLDAYSLDSVSVCNSSSVRRKGAGARASKRSYGNPAFSDPAAPSHPLTFPALSNMSGDRGAVEAEFSAIPQVTPKADELPEGADTRNRYANVIPLPETRVVLSCKDGDPLSQYINANYVRGPKNTDKFYIACQAPLSSTVQDFWRMVWETQAKVILMLTDLVEDGVEKCADYLPPSEVTDCHRLFGDFQVTLKKREVKDKYVVSSIQLKNMETNLWREATHMWYMGWPSRGVPDDPSTIIAFLIEARAFMRSPSAAAAASGAGKRDAPSPCVVHCSPGTGRTGTVLAIDLCVREFETTRQVDIPRTVYRLRKDRAGCVQTKEQYMFIYKALNLYATKLTGGALDSI